MRSILFLCSVFVLLYMLPWTSDPTTDLPVLGFVGGLLYFTTAVSSKSSLASAAGTFLALGALLGMNGAEPGSFAVLMAALGAILALPGAMCAKD